MSGTWSSIADVCTVETFRGARAGSEPDLLLEVPHGATLVEHYEAVRSRLASDLPSSLRDFFCVNTDVGAPELARRVADLVVAARPERCAAVVRCLVPRTFVDCNRVIDADAAARTSRAGEMTPGLHAWVRDPRDVELLLGRYRAYRALVEWAFERVCENGGRALMVHTYAPRNIDVAVDADVVASLRAAYAPERVASWPLRAEIDLITDTPGGERLADDDLASSLEREARAAGFEVACNRAYALHESTLAHALARRHRGRTLCFEVRRDLVVREFTPFDEMRGDPARVERLAVPVATASGRLGARDAASRALDR